MIRITILSVGRVKENYYLQAIAEYVKRLSRYCILEEIVLQEIETPDNLEKEGDKILPLLHGKIVVMDKEGKKLTSDGLASLLKESTVNCSQMTFVIGSSKGLCQRVKQKADLMLSFSALTFPHSLAKVMLCEQLYRAFSIIAGGKYHK